MQSNGGPRRLRVAPGDRVIHLRVLQLDKFEVAHLRFAIVLEQVDTRAGNERRSELREQIDAIRIACGADDLQVELEIRRDRSFRRLDAGFELVERGANVAELRSRVPL